MTSPSARSISMPSEYVKRTTCPSSGSSKGFTKGNWALGKDEMGSMRKPSPDSLNLSRIPFFKSLEDIHEHFLDQFKNFMIMLFECHLQIQSDKLSEMSMREAVLRPKDRCNLKNTLEIRSHQHLFV